ncbi:MAG: MFS transporter [Beijerinckiaceae bacterium]|nr:MFS transporter [Beijerinckiaceae bacterium]
MSAGKLGASNVRATQDKRSALSRSGLAAYAAGSFSTGVFSTVPTVLLLYFCTQILSIDPALASILVLVPKVWAILWDPLVGSWSDRAVTPLGRRRPFMLVGAAGVTLAFIAIFSPPRLPAGPLFVWMMASYFALATSYSLFAVPYVAIPAEIGATARERSRLVGWRMLVVMVGVLTGAAVAPLVVAAAGGGAHGYAVMSVIVATVCGLAMVGPIIALGGRDQPVAVPGVRRSGWRQAIRNPRFVTLALTYIILLTAIGAVSSVSPYLVTGVFHRAEGDIGIALLAMLGTMTATLPFWVWAGRSLGERRALVFAIVVFATASPLLGLAAVLDVSWPIALALFALMGLPLAGLQLLPFTLSAHVIHEAVAASDQTGAGEGVFAGLWTAAEKLGLALGPALTGVAMTFGADFSRVSAPFTAIVPAVLAIASLPLLLGLNRRQAAVPGAAF